MDQSIKEDLRFWDGNEREYAEWKAAASGTRTSYFDTANSHVMVPVKVGDQKALIDEEIAEVVSLLWWAGVKTTGSCQGGPRQLPFPPDLSDDEIEEWKQEDELNWQAHIGLPDLADVKRLVEILAPEGDDYIVGNLADHMTGGRGQTEWDRYDEFVAENYPEELVWDWEMKPPRWVDGEVKVSFVTRFDPTDIPELRKRLIAYKEGKR